MVRYSKKPFHYIFPHFFFSLWFVLSRSRRICFCKLGFPRSLATAKAKDGFLGQIRRLEEFLEDPWKIRVTDGKETIQVAVPRIPAPPPPLPIPILPPVGDAVAGDDEAAAASAQAKRSALQRKAAAAMVAAEDFARRFESGDLVVRLFLSDFGS